MSYSDILKTNATASAEVKTAYVADLGQLADFEAAANVLVARYKAGGRLYIAGNGGSAADAQHLAAEFVSKLARDRAPLPAEAMTTDSSILTAIGNDYGFEQLFARQLLGKAQKNDVFLAITTSGTSPNIIQALKAARENGIATIAFLGGDGGVAKDLADHSLIVPSRDTARIQEMHIVLAHSLCQCVEQELFGP
jgi:D-sedoheptulose 7-phosphate isomerase